MYKNSAPVTFTIAGINFETGVYETDVDGVVHPQVKLFADGVKIAQVNMFFNGAPWYEGDDSDLKNTLWFIEKNFNEAITKHLGDNNVEVSDEWWEKILDGLRGLTVENGQIRIPR